MICWPPAAPLWAICGQKCIKQIVLDTDVCINHYGARNGARRGIGKYKHKMGNNSIYLEHVLRMLQSPAKL